MKRIVAWLLVIMMACSSVQVQASNVKPEEIGQESKTPTGESEPTQVGSQDAIQQDAPQDTANQEPAQQKEAVSEKKTGEQEVKINYLCVGSPYIATEGEQKVVLSWGDGTENISDMKLVYEKNDETKAEWACEKQEKETYLFTKQFSGEDKGTYRVSGIQFIQDGQIHEYLLDNLGINARFGIGEEYEGYVREESVKAKGISEEDVSATVLNLETNETKEVETGVKEALSDAVKEANVTTGPKKSSKARSAARARELVIALDPGHDDTHAGASGNGLREQELTLKIAMYCKAELERYSGVRIHMTRTTGACPNPGQSSTEDNKARIRQAVAAGASVYISFHLNASTSSGAAGAEVYYPNYNWKPDIGMHGEALAQKILDEIVALGISNRGIKLNTSSGDYTYEDGSLADAYTVQNTCKKLGIPGLIIEHAFVSNRGDASFLDSESDLQRLGQADAAGIAKYYGLSIGTWIQDNNGWKYQESNGNFVVNTWKAIGGSTYYFDQNGYRVSGWQDIGGKRYFFMPDGVMLTGWISFGATRYFLMPDGHMLTGWCSFGDTRYYLGTDGVMQTGWRDISGKRYFFMPEGYMLRGWISFGNTRYYLDANGAMVTGNQTINGTQYIFDQAGVLQSYTGWRTISGRKYYYIKDVPQTGWQEIGGKRYFFMPDGHMLTSWISFGETRYFLMPDGHMLTGWASFGNPRYYFGTDGIMQTGWRDIEGKRYFFMPDGHMLTGWASFGNPRYYLGLDGVMVTGKHLIDGVEYEFYDNGVMKGYTGWKTISGKKYYYIDDAMQTGWEDIAGERYFFMPDGHMLTGWASFGNPRYYLGDNGVMLKGWQQIGAFKYYFGADGIVQTGWRTVEGNRHFFMPDGHMLTGWISFGDVRYYLGLDGVMRTGWQDIGGKRYFFMPDGMQLRGWISFGDVRYYLDAEGAMVTGWRSVDSLWYFFAEDGKLDRNPSGNPPTTATYLIEGGTTVSVFQMTNYFTKKNKIYPAFYANSDAPTLTDFCRIYYEEAAAEGIKAEVAFTQAMKETGWLSFGGDVTIGQYNFAGIGTTGGGVAGASFDCVRTGIRAQIQHLKAYGSKSPLVNPAVDPRFGLVTRGSSIYVEWLGIQENPYGKGWAAGANYGYDIVKMIADLKS